MDVMIGAQRPLPSHAHHPWKQTAVETRCQNLCLSTARHRFHCLPAPDRSWPHWKQSEVSRLENITWARRNAVISSGLGGGQGLCPHTVNHSPHFLPGQYKEGTAAFGFFHSFKRTRSLGAGNLSGHNPRQSCGRRQSPDVQERTSGLDGGSGPGYRDRAATREGEKNERRRCQVIWGHGAGQTTRTANQKPVLCFNYLRELTFDV